VCAGQLVDAALGAGVKVAVCSSNSQRNVKLIVESMGVRHGCAAWVCGMGVRRGTLLVPALAAVFALAREVSPESGARDK